MEIRPIAPGFAVSPQIAADDVARAAEAGYKTILCNRPDGEAADQTPVAQIEQACQAAGVDFRFLPIVPGVITHEALEGVEDALKNCPQPILAYCRTGTRSSMLWALACSSALAPDALLGAAAQAGYDLSGMRPMMEERFAQAQSDGDANT